MKHIKFFEEENWENVEYEIDDYIFLVDDPQIVFIITDIDESDPYNYQYKVESIKTGNLQRNYNYWVEEHEIKRKLTDIEKDAIKYNL